MRKVFVLFLLSISSSLFCTGLSNYPLSDTDQGLYLTGHETLVTNSFLWGRHQNLAISPNYFNALGIRNYTEDYKKRDFGYYIFKTDTYLNFLKPSVATPLDSYFSNFTITQEFGFTFLFGIKQPINNLSLYWGPELVPGFHGGYFSGVDNILAQTYFYGNLGINIKAEYEIMKTLRAGIDIYNSVIGFDFGRNGYNKDFISEIQGTNWSNFNRGKYRLYLSYDISRTEVVSLGYSHNFLALYGGEYDLTEGINSIELTMTKRLVR